MNEPKTKRTTGRRRLLKAYRVIERLTAKNGESPSYPEIQKAMRFKSVAGAYRVVSDLISAGLAVKTPHKWRGLILLPMRKKRGK